MGFGISHFRVKKYKKKAPNREGIGAFCIMDLCD